MPDKSRLKLKKKGEPLVSLGFSFIYKFFAF